jgi:hypothetical protein
MEIPISPRRKADRNFYVLALSQKNVRLFLCDMKNVNSVDLEGEDIPRNIDEAMKYTYEEKQAQAHTISSRVGQSPGSMAHGHGNGREDLKMRIEEFLHQVNEGLMKIIKNERVPLILAGVEYMMAIYNKVNTYPYTLEEGIHGNPDHMSGRELQEKAFTILRQEIFRMHH